jgi:hypothetical protein
MFCRGGTVTPLPPTWTGTGPGIHGLWAEWTQLWSGLDAYKGKHEQQSLASKRTEENEEGSLLCPVRLLLVPFFPRSGGYHKLPLSTSRPSDRRRPRGLLQWYQS